MLSSMIACRARASLVLRAGARARAVRTARAFAVGSLTAQQGREGRPASVAAPRGQEAAQNPVEPRPRAAVRDAATAPFMVEELASASSGRAGRLWRRSNVYGRGTVRVNAGYGSNPPQI